MNNIEILAMGITSGLVVWICMYVASLVKENKIEELESRLDEIEDGHFDTVECETCGCLLKKYTATRGKSKIVGVDDQEAMKHCLPYDEKGHPIIPQIETIKQTYYCKLHAPKKKKTK